MKNAARHVALIIETSLAYGRGILSGVSKYMAEHEPWVIYVDERSLSDPAPNWLNDMQCEGVIMRAKSQQILMLVRELGVPAVDTLQHFVGPDYPVVISDPCAVAELAADHLLARHFQHFAFVGVEEAHWSNMRRDSLVEYLAQKGKACQVYTPAAGPEGTASWEREQRSLGEWLAKLPKPIGVVSPFDLRARQIIDVCRGQGLKVPEEVAVIGVGNDEVLCNLGEPPLTSVKLNFELLGYEAAALLDQLMSGEMTPSNPRLIKPLGVATRRSTDVMAIDDPLTVQALRYIQSHACEGIKVADVAEHCGASRRVIEMNFSKFIGCSPHDYIVSTKVACVKQMLLETDRSLDTIAAKCGFHQAPYMSVLFKQRVGMTPGEFRRKGAMSK